MFFTTCDISFSLQFKFSSRTSSKKMWKKLLMNQLHSHFSLPVSTVYKKTEPVLSGCIWNPIYRLSHCARMDVSGLNHIQVWPFSGIMNSVLACVMTQLCAWVNVHYIKSSHRVQFKRTNVWTQQTGKGSVATAAAKHCSFISRSCEERGEKMEKEVLIMMGVSFCGVQGYLYHMLQSHSCTK